MYTLVTLLSSRRFAAEQLPVLALALVIAEFAYRFHSFTLEALAFLVTWFVLDGVAQALRERFRPPRRRAR